MLFRCNESVRDFTLVLTTVSNIVFDLILIAILGDDQQRSGPPNAGGERGEGITNPSQ